MTESTAGAPEEFFLIPDHQERELNIDVLLALLSRSTSILTLLECNGEDMKEGFKVDHETLLHSIYSVKGMIEQADSMIRHSAKF